MNWFRLYSEARNDAKLRTLSDAEHRTWFNLLCYAAEQKPDRGEINNFDIDLLAIEVAGGDSDLLLETLKKLSRLRIVRVTENSNICFLKFEERQYDKPSDRPARVKERVHAHRERAGKETPEPADEGVTAECETPCNAMKRDETPCNAHTQNREYSENTQKEKESPPTPRSGGGARATKVSPKISTSANKPKPKGLNPAAAAFHERRIAQCGRSPTRKPEEEKRAGDLWAEHGEEAYRRALEGYFGCLGNSDDWPQRQGFTFIAFLRQFDRWEAGKPPNPTTGKENRNGPDRTAAPGIVSKYQPNFRANV